MIQKHKAVIIEIYNILNFLVMVIVMSFLENEKRVENTFFILNHSNKTPKHLNTWDPYGPVVLYYQWDARALLLCLIYPFWLQCYHVAKFLLCTYNNMTSHLAMLQRVRLYNNNNNDDEYDIPQTKKGIQKLLKCPGFPLWIILPLL